MCCSEQAQARRQAVQEAKATFKATKRETKQVRKEARAEFKAVKREARKAKREARKEARKAGSAQWAEKPVPLSPASSTEEQAKGAPPTYDEATSDKPQTKPTTGTLADIGDEYRLSLLAQCAEGNHQQISRFGCAGIVAASCLFPVGLLGMYLDREVVCQRCGVVLKAKKVGGGRHRAVTQG